MMVSFRQQGRGGLVVYDDSRESTQDHGERDSARRIGVEKWTGRSDAMRHSA